MLGLVLAAIFIVLNGFFVAAEFAFVKLHATRSILDARVRRGERAAIDAKKIIARLDSYLSVTQLGVTLSSLGLGWVGEPAVERALESLFPAAPASPAVHAVLVATAFGALTLAHVLLGELVPKLLAIQRSEATALTSATPLRLMHVSFRPILWVLEKCSAVILRGMGLRADVSEGALTEEEIVGVLAASTARMPKGKEKAELLTRVLRFADRTARHAMVPRVDVVFLPIETSTKDALTLVRAQGYSRVPLTRKKALDDVAGYLYAKDLLADGTGGDATLESLRRDVLFVPESQGLLDVLRSMQREQSHIAMVVDEYGGTSGIVTLEDLLEEIVGEIRDESDEEAPRVANVGDRTYDVDPSVTLDELVRVGLDFEGDQGEPLGVVVLQALGRIPRVGDRTRVGANGRATVTGMSRRRVTRIRVELDERKGPTPSSDDEL